VAGCGDPFGGVGFFRSFFLLLFAMLMMCLMFCETQNSYLWQVGRRVTNLDRMGKNSTIHSLAIATVETRDT